MDLNNFLIPKQPDDENPPTIYAGQSISTAATTTPQSMPDISVSYQRTSPLMSSGTHPSVLPGIPEDEAANMSGMSAESTIDGFQAIMKGDTATEPLTASVNPALLLTRYDKRKSSPAVLGLPLGLDPAQSDALSTRLSQPRNSIEAAVLLANFNRLQDTGDRTPENETSRGKRSWPDDMSVASETQNKKAWMADGDVGDVTTRRHSYDVSMNWKNMPPSFLERSELFPNSLTSSSSASSADLPRESNINSSSGLPRAEASKLTWTQDGMLFSNPPATQEYPPPSRYEFMHPVSVPPNQLYLPSMPPMYHPLSHPSMPNPPPPPPPPPAAADLGQKRDQSYMQYYSHPQQPLPPQSLPHPSMSPYGYQPMPPQHLQHPHSQQAYAPQAPPPSAANVATAQGSPVRPVKRARRAKADEEEGDAVEPGDPDFPDMPEQDVEQARTDPEARPRRQKIRFDEDRYTPHWVRYNGQAKEGLCDTCQPGKWLQLKNSAYWYHKQFFHGISSVSGIEFVQPLETRWADQDVLEGLCHQCHQWVPVSHAKRKNSVLWYRHAHKCHVYNKPKTAKR